jgi:hypothetical protein
LIGARGPNTKEEVDSRRNSYQFWKGTKFEQPAYWETELTKLKNLNVKVNTFYVDDAAKESFEKIAERTGGTCSYLDLLRSDSQDILLGLVFPSILKMIGEGCDEV